MKIKKWNSSTSAWVQEYPEVNVDAIVATGTPSSTTYLRGDGTWATVTSGSTFNGGTITNDLVISKDNPVLVLKDTGESNDTDHVGYLSFRDSANAEKAWLGFGSSGNTDFTVSNGYGGDINLIGGNVGIGTTSPTAKLSIVDSSTKGLEFEEITGGIMRILAYDRTNTIEVPLELRGDSIDFETNGTRRFLITDSGAAVTGALTVGGTSVSLDGHTHTFASLTSKPTTLSGYGITDAYSSSNPSGYQTAAQVASAVSALVDSAPSTLDTLNELAAALGDDPNFATTITNALAGKLSTSGKAADSNLLDGVDSTGFLRVSSSSSSPLNGNFAIGSASSRNFIQSHNSQPLDINPLGNAVTINGSSNTVWHAGNDGSGSGLSADNVDGYHIVVGSTGTDTNTLYFTT